MEPATFNESKLKKQLLISTLAHPFVLFPVLAGMTDLMALWTFSIDSGPGIFAGIAGILGGIGVFLTKWLAGDDRLTGKVLDKMDREARKKREHALDDLERKLVDDGDPRTETCLRDLRTLTAAFRDPSIWASSLNTSSSLAIMSGVQTLFRQCVRYLEKSLDLWYTTRKIAVEDARKPLLDQRENMIREVTESIRKLGGILAGIQGLDGDSADSAGELERIRRELDRNLEVARTVNRRMESIEREIDRAVK